MDTDDLSTEAYKGIIIESGNFNHDLTLQFGLLSNDCKNEQEFINKSIQLIIFLRNATFADLTDIFFGKAPNITQLNKTLDKISDNIASVKRIPIAKRNYE
jgi:hypothetical protein